MTGKEALEKIWNTDYRTCRFCKKTTEDFTMVKYGVRHYAHPGCFLDALGTDGFDRLSLHQLEKFPKDIAKGRNVHEFLKMAIRAERAEYAK